MVRASYCWVDVSEIVVLVVCSPPMVLLISRLGPVPGPVGDGSLVSVRLKLMKRVDAVRVDVAGGIAGGDVVEAREVQRLPGRVAQAGALVVLPVGVVGAISSSV